jgi:Domain of unknown function (DUF6268)
MKLASSTHLSRSKLALIVGFAAVLCATNVFASIDDVIEAIANSELRFSRTESNVPFPAIGWIRLHHYSSAEFEEYSGGASPGSFQQQDMNVGFVAPVYVDKRDLYVAGFDAAYDTFDFDAPNIGSTHVFTATPVLGWLRQQNPKSQLAAFVAPAFSTALSDNNRWGVNAFTGLLGTYQYNDRLMWIYGGVYEYSFGSHFLYPYIGLNWLPSAQWSVALILPWPNVIYAPTDRFFVSLGVAPGGASWQVQRDGQEAVASFGSWNLSAGAAYRLSRFVWVRGEIGMAGLHGLQLSNRSSSGVDANVDRHPVVTLQLEFRP